MEPTMMRALEGAEVEEKPEAVLSARELIESLAWIAHLRWLAAAGVAAAITVARWCLGIPLPLAPLYGIAAGLALYNCALYVITIRLRAERPPSPFDPSSSLPSAGLRMNRAGSAQGRLSRASVVANTQISLDLFFLAGLLYFSGGIENPFVFYFVFHIVIASILLSRRATFSQTALASLIVLALAVAQNEPLLPHYHLTGVMPEQMHNNAVLAYGTWFVVASTLFLTAYFATSITARLREREAEILGLSRSLEEKAADLSRANEKLRLIERTKSEYMRRVAHELRSPLATVYQMVGVVVDGHKGEIPPAAVETLTRARVRLRLLMDVARDLLVLSRAREADLSREMQQVSLGDAIAAVAADLEQRAQEAQVALEVSVAEGLPPIAGDPESLAQLVDNLGSNAIKYTPAGGAVRITARADDGRVELAVADSGIGIPREELPHIFDEFYRAANAREGGREGTGLGLSIVKAICASHGAEITVQSEPGRGSTFRVRFRGAVTKGTGT
jgi:signal transduction histidine kinase